MLIAGATEAGTAGFRSPRMLLHDHRNSLIIMEELPGCQLTTMIPTPEPDVFAAVGNALAGLHRSEICLPASWSPGGELAALERAMADVRLALPTLEGAIQSLLQMIERRGTELHWDDRAPIHANLFGDQILVDETGEVGIVDWDDLCLGDPLFDVGQLSSGFLVIRRRAGRVGKSNGRCTTGPSHTGRGHTGPTSDDRTPWYGASLGRQSPNSCQSVWGPDFG